MLLILHDALAMRLSWTAAPSCVAACVQDAWGKSVGADGKVLMLADGSALFTKVSMRLPWLPPGWSRLGALIPDYVMPVQQNGCCKDARWQACACKINIPVAVLGGKPLRLSPCRVQLLPSM